ncbi:hypothetical protein PBI_NABY_16 [Microbacterium phage Naby]|uniref:Uncharacterized protein n=1 Tax=Microbacterium phage BonaeVitae TaxID=2126925 RepID=A0A2R3ZZG6_9CAUD|nr:hypothetical protein JTF59_gp16 [Microbacterium phage BonaeVitae]AVR56166.1 hypothetical protein SEA_BONAEVITAE_16 [Microbacterium phage BonaeVitae]QFG10658.2 hypothetical protein PBI_NABY_16 [Microbacterium phage Naby]
MMLCRGCSQPAVDPQDVPRYDTENPAADPERPQLAGPYCPSCWPVTVTGRLNPQEESE